MPNKAGTARRPRQREYATLVKSRGEAVADAVAARQPSPEACVIRESSPTAVTERRGSGVKLRDPPGETVAAGGLCDSGAAVISQQQMQKWDLNRRGGQTC